MTDTPDSATSGETRAPGTASHRPTSVVYVPGPQRGCLSIPPVLRDEHNMHVDVASSLGAAAQRTRDTETPACIVCEASEQAGLTARPADDHADRLLSVPVVIAVEAERSSDVQRALRRDWVDDVVVRDADTENGLLLAHRIERCVTRRREHATAKRLRSALERVDRGVALATPDCRLWYANPAFEVLRDGSGTVTGENLGDLLATVATDSVVREFRATAGDDSWDGEFTVETDGDGPRSIRLSVNPVRDDTGDVACVVALLHDVTERERGNATAGGSGRPSSTRVTWSC